jgi:nitrogen regulatory protein PII 1
MKMIQAMIRPERERGVVSSLEKAGIYPYTRHSVFGRGRQRGLRVGSVHYEELGKVSLMLVVEDSEVQRTVDVIKTAAHTGNPGDGKIFVSTLVEARTIRKT